MCIFLKPDLAKSDGRFLFKVSLDKKTKRIMCRVFTCAAVRLGFRLNFEKKGKFIEKCYCIPLKMQGDGSREMDGERIKTQALRFHA